MFVALARCTLVLALLARASTGLAEKAPNVLVIVADDLGYSDLGCYGGEIRTPNLDRLAAGGTRLTQFYTTARCCPSRACLLTGQYPHRVGLGHMTKDLGRPGYRGRVSEDAHTIAQVLGTAGYRSFLAGKWHLGTNDPTEHGFEEFYGTLVSAKTFWDPEHFTRLPEGRAKKEYKPGTFYATDAVTDHAIEFLDLARETPEKPWFLYLAYNAPHFPLQAPPETIAKYASRYRYGWDLLRDQRIERMKLLGIVPESTWPSPRSLYFDWGENEPGRNPGWHTLPADRQADLARRMAIYAAMVDRMDENVGRVLENLRDNDEDERTLVVFTSDNGACAEWDPFGFDFKSGPKTKLHTADELDGMGRPGTFHSVGSGWANASNTPWRLYKHYVHEGGIATPCIVRWPGRPRSRSRIDPTPSHLVDLLPTILDVTDVPYPERIGDRATLPPVGRSMQRDEDAPPDERTLFFEHEGHRAVRQGRWKLVALRDQPWELYDFSKDRIELRDLSAKHPEVVERLSKTWDEWAEAIDVTPLPKDYGVEYVKPAE